jgi:death-on-curing protein
MILFLSKDIVIVQHDEQIHLYGGTSGILSPNGLDAAINEPRQTFDGIYLHSTIYEMAAAYAYHLALGHAFVDGNKRIARMAMITFLEINGLDITASEDETMFVILAITNKTMNKQDVAKWLESVTILRKRS